VPGRPLDEQTAWTNCLLASSGHAHFISRSHRTCNKHCSKIPQETLLNIVPNELLTFRVAQSQDSFTLLSIKDEVHEKKNKKYQGCDVISALSALAIQVLCTGCR
jgi:hypothetical protein